MVDEINFANQVIAKLDTELERICIEINDVIASIHAIRDQIYESNVAASEYQKFKQDKQDNKNCLKKIVDAQRKKQP